MADKSVSDLSNDLYEILTNIKTGLKKLSGEELKDSYLEVIEALNELYGFIPYEDNVSEERALVILRLGGYISEDATFSGCHSVHVTAQLAIALGDPSMESIGYISHSKLIKLPIKRAKVLVCEDCEPYYYVLDEELDKILTTEKIK